MLVHVKNNLLTWEILTYKINGGKTMNEHSTFLFTDRKMKTELPGELLAEYAIDTVIVQNFVSPPEKSH